jgi:small redox-active disulfide protein 2
MTSLINYIAIRRLNAMSLFNRKKEKPAGGCNCGEGCECQTTNDNSSCCCGSSSTDNQPESKASSGIKILGSGCQKCNDLENATREALLELGIDEPIEHVTDLVQIASFGVMSTPALVIDNKVVSLGKVLKKDEVVKLIKKVRG